MKKKNAKIKPGIIKYLLLLPLFLLSFCQSEFEEPPVGSENKLTIDAELLELMKSAIQSNSDQNLTQNKGALSKSAIAEDDGQCTNFLYPMTFEVFSGDNPIPEMKVINSDEELMAFIEMFTYEDSVVASTSNYEMYIYFPITLLDTDGYETVLNNLTELEGTLQMAVEACESFNDSSNGGADDGSTGGSSDGSVDGSDDGSTGSSADGGSTGGSDDGSDDGPDDDESADDSDNDSDNGSDDDSSDDDSDDDGSDDDSDDESDDDIVTSDNQNDNGYKFCDKNSKKVYICHKGKTICVSVNAIWGHLQHHEEDFLGTCDD